MEHEPTNQSEPSKESTVFKSELLLSDDEIRQRGIGEHQIELYRRMQYQASFGIDTWLDLLAEHTFDTAFVELTYQEGLHLAHYLDTVPDEQILQHIAERIDHVIRTKFPHGAFVKLNTRSPKDVPVYDFESEAVKTKIAEEFDSLGEKLGNDNEEVWAFIRATIKMTRVNSGLEALDLLRRSTRIREDLGKILRFGEPHFSARVTVRAWLDEVAERPQYEFRGFAHNKELHAVTQYFSMTYDSEVHRRRDEIAAKIKTFHDSIRDKIPHSSYVIDFYVTRDNRVLIVELNPFHIGAGAGLFTWREHRNLFMNGPYTFRVVEEVPADTLELLPTRWLKWLDKKYHPGKWIGEDEVDPPRRWCVVL